MFAVERPRLRIGMQATANIKNNPSQMIINT
jgi:hypothetical protein